MSIIVESPEYLKIDQTPRSRLLDSPVRELLDHIAVELAAEYVRLMEAAAGAEAPSSAKLHADD
jgi:hypothetical protein